MTHDWSQLRDLATRIAGEAGALARARRSHAVIEPVATKSTDVDIVTAADQATEQLIAERLTGARPHDAIVGEEGADRAGSSGVTWLVDPIDGTTNFFYGLPGWVVSIAAADDDGVAAAAVYDPTADVMYSAHRGGGATRNGRQISVSPVSPPLSRALVGTGFSYRSDQRTRQAEILLRVLPEVRDIRRLGSAARDLCLVAEGAYDAYYEAGLNRWDLAGGWLIAAEAGATVAYLTPATKTRRLLLAAAPSLFGDLAAVLSAAGADTDP